MEDSGGDEVIHDTLHARWEETDEAETQPVIQQNVLPTYTSSYLLDHVTVT